MKVLVVGRDPLFCATLCELLMERGFPAGWTASRRESIARARAQRYGVILMELDRNDTEGIELVGRLRHMSPSSRIILLATRLNMSTSMLAILQGADDMLTKPFTIEALERAMSAECRSRAAEDERGNPFDRLRAAVVDRGLCNLCSGCVSFCAATGIEALSVVNDAPSCTGRDACVGCGVCYWVCPCTEKLEAELEKEFPAPDGIGRVELALSLRTTEPSVAARCCDGGFVTSFLRYLLEKELITGAVVAKREGLFNSRPVLARKPDELLDCAGTSLFPAGNVGAMHIFRTYVPALAVLQSGTIRGTGGAADETDGARVALVGTPCQIESLRKMQAMDLPPGRLATLSIGLFCYESLSFGREGAGILEKAAGCNLSKVKRVNIREHLVLRRDDGTEAVVGLDDVEALARPACLTCTDFTSPAADISVGGVGSPPGYTTMLARTREAAALVSAAVKQGYFTVASEPPRIDAVSAMVRRKRVRAASVATEKGL